MKIGGATIQNIAQTPRIEGSNFDDYIRAISDGFPFTIVHGNGGNDDIKADYYADAIYGDDGDDTLDVNDSPYGPNAYGGDGNDTIYGGYNGPEAYGGGGDDFIDNSGFIDGGDGNDVLHSKFSYESNQANGGAGDDTIDADNFAVSNLFRGGAGADGIDGEDGDDELYSDGDTGDGLDHGLEQDTLVGGLGDDTLSIGYGDNADGGGGDDRITIVWDPAAAGIVLGTGAIVHGHPFAFGAGVIDNIERLDALYATDNADIVHVGAQPGTVIVHGGGGNDQLSGSGGSAVYLFGDDGNDRLLAGAGGDTLEGGDGNDRFVINSAGETAVENFGEGTDKVQSSVSFTLGDNVEKLTLTGGANSDGTGNFLANVINGNSGNNELVGLEGNDRLTGGAGEDRMTGGADADHFVFKRVGDFSGATAATADRITDFDQAAHDKIVLSKIDAVAGGGNDPFDFIGTDAFGGHAGELRYEQDGGDTLVTGDLDGDGAADFMIALNGLYTLAAGDFGL